MGRWLMALGAAVPLAAAWVRPAPEPPQISFERDLRPILRAHCISCHGPEQKLGGLDLSSLSGLKRGGVSGPLWIPGRPDASLLLRRLRGLDGKPAMPMGFQPLPAATIAKFGQWVGEGARLDEPGPIFVRDVLPILRAHCSSCHAGPDPRAGLDLSSAEGLRRGGVSGPALIPGDSQRSLILKRLRGEDGKPRMPMGFQPLSPRQMATLENWVRTGARYEGEAPRHWAYVPPQAPRIPSVSRPDWIRNPIDAFVLERLDREGLRPSPEAGRATLLRRVSLDLIGLPPTPEEVAAFLADRRPDAYERAVDRLLASPHYGERQARIWLDLARYADSNGFEADRGRIMWPYRDWVIAAFNRNLPFDRFTIEQLAGDLLPKAGQDQLIATGFHRNAMFNEEGGVDPGEQLFYVLLDRVAVTGTVWLGSSIQCARCHDHKYDPISQKDHYSMLAFFAGTDAKLEGDSNQGQARYLEPTLTLVPNEVKADLAAVQREMLALGRERKAEAERLRAEQPRWEAQALAAWKPVPAGKLRAGAMQFEGMADGGWKAIGNPAAQDEYVLEGDLPAGDWTALRVEALPDPAFPLGGPGLAGSGNFILSRVSVQVDGKEVRFGPPAVDFNQGGYDLQGLFDADGNTGWAIYPQQARPHELILPFASPIRGGTVRLSLEMKSATWPQHLIGRLRWSATQESDPGQFALGDVRDLLGKPSRTPAEEARVRERFEALHPALAPLRKRSADLARRMAELNGRRTTTMVMRDRPGARLESPVYRRGEFLSPEDPVPAKTPTALPPMSPNAPRNRLGLAQWLVSPDNPLTARVQANRMWEQYFGRGLVETVDDFGTQGARPSHPELLDWLAVKLVKSGWDLKALHRLIVTSATYRQSSRSTPELLRRDPSNILLARGPRFRMEAEMIRDSALAVSGLLDRTIGGPSVFPYQPEGVWDSPYNGERWTESAGRARHRRGLYVYWKRTATYPSFMALDATSREQCTPRRLRTNTPLQALTLLNDPAYFEAARGLANLSWSEVRSRRPELRTAERRAVVRAFQRALGRSPTDQERATLERLYAKASREFAAHPDRAAAVATDARLAALTVVANVILNLDEAVTKE